MELTEQFEQRIDFSGLGDLVFAETLKKLRNFRADGHDVDKSPDGAFEVAFLFLFRRLVISVFCVYRCFTECFALHKLLFPVSFMPYGTFIILPQKYTIILLSGKIDLKCLFFKSKP